MLVANHLECIKGTRSLFRQVSFALNPGTVLRIEGTNGSGKTSLIRLISGLQKPASGEILWKNIPTAQLGGTYHADLVYIAHANGIKDELSAVENLMLSAQLAGNQISKRTACTALQQLGLAGREELPTKLLSQGQKRRAALARLLLSSSPLWLLDEPLASLDQSAQELVEQLLAKHLAGGGLAVLTTHQQVNTPAHATQYLQLGSPVLTA